MMGSELISPAEVWSEPRSRRMRNGFTAGDSARLMGGGDGMSEISLIDALKRRSTGMIAVDSSSRTEIIPASLLQAVRALDQETGQETEFEALQGVVDSLVEWFLLDSRNPRSVDGDDLALCLRAVCWLAPRFQALSNDQNGIAKNYTDLHGEATKNGFVGIVGRNVGGVESEQPRRKTEEPLQLLLELAAARLGTGVDGLHTSLALIGGTLKGLKSMRVRKAFAASLRAHLGAVQLDSVLRFDPPKYLRGVGAGGEGEVASPGRLALPPSMLNWATFRKYSVTMWIRPDPTSSHHAGGSTTTSATLFRFRNGDSGTGTGIGVEATLRDVPDSSSSSGMRKEIVVTSFQRASSNKSFSARCKFGPQEEEVQLGVDGVGGGIRQGDWRFVVVSHGQPYVKRAGRLRVWVDGSVVLDAELPYPSGNGQAAKEPISRSCFCEGLVGEAGPLALYEDELDLAAIKALLAAGPNHLGAAQPLPVAMSDTLPPLLHTQMLSGPGAKAAATARLVAAFLPRMCEDGLCPAWRPGGTIKVHDVVMSSPGMATAHSKGGLTGGGDLARLEGPVRLVVPYSGRDVAPGVATRGGVYDAWFRAGGTRALLYAAARVVDELADSASEALAKEKAGDEQALERAEAEAQEGRELLGELLRTVAALLASGPVHREEFLQIHGFHMLSTVLQRLPRPAQDLNGPVLGACLHLLHVVDAFQELELVGAALQGVLLDFRLWSDAGVNAQALLLEGISSVAERRVAQLRAFVGPQLLLDVLRVHVCNPSTHAHSHGRNARRSSPSGNLPLQRPDGRVIARPVSPKRSGSGGDASAAIQQQHQALERCVGACMRMLKAMLVSELSSPQNLPEAFSSPSRNETAGSAVGSAGPASAGPEGVGGGGQGSDSHPHDKAFYGHMPFLEGFADGFDIGGGGGSEGMEPNMRSPGVGGGVGGMSGASAAGVVAGIDAAVVCLQECQSMELQRGILGVLLELRKEKPGLLRRQLLRCMFLWGAAPILLYRKGYTTDVRRDCLALSLWLLIEAHAAGEERLLAPSNRPPPRQKRPSVSPTTSVSESIAPKRDGGSPRRSGGEGGGGGGNNDVSSAGGGVGDWAANAASREHYRSVHLALARIVALSVSQGFWGALPGSSSSVLAPIHEDVVQVALSGGVVQPGPEKEEGTARDDSGDRSGGKSDTDGGGRSGASKGGGALWLSLPYVAALLPGASPDTRRQAAMSINIVLKSDTAARKTLLRLSEAAWADALVEMALCERDLEEPFSLSGAAVTASSDDTASASVMTKDVNTDSPNGGWEAVERFGDGAVSTPLGEKSVCEELALDAAGCVVADSIVERPRGWTILRPLLASLDRAAWQRVGTGTGRGGREWHRVSLCKLSATVMQRVARGSGRWTELTLDGLNKLMLLVEERLFPGEELAAAMAAATVGDTLAPTAAAAATSGPGVPGAREGDVARASSVSSEMEGGWGEDGTTAGALSHLVECMLEIVRGLRGMLSSEPLPPGQRAPVAAVAAAAAAAAGDAGLRARALTALWPALRALGRVPCLRDVGTELSRAVYHEVFLSLQVLLALPEVTPATGKAATLEAFLSLRKAISVCDEDLSRPDPSMAGSSWGWGRRSTSWGRRKRANGPFDPDAAALAQDKRGLLGAVAMAAVQSLHTPSLTPIAAAEAPDLQTAENMPNISGRASGPQNARRGRGGGGRGGGSKRGGGPGGSGRGRGRRHGHEGGRVGVEAGGAETMTGVRGTEGSSKASMAVAEMLDGASDCADMDEIFKSLSSVLAAAQEESRQDFADFVPLFRNMGSGRRGTPVSTSSGNTGHRPSNDLTYNPSSGGGNGSGSSPSRRGVEEPFTTAYAHVPASYNMPFGLPPPVHRIPLPRDPSAEFTWPAEPMSALQTPLLAPAAGESSEEDAGAGVAAMLAATSIDSPMPDASAVADSSSGSGAGGFVPETPRGSLLFGPGGAAGVVALVSSRAVEHRALVEEERLRLEYAMAALDAAGARTRKHWRRVSRLSEAEAWAEEEDEDDNGGMNEGWRARGERLTGLHRECRWKLAGNEHEGQEPGRFRPVLQPVVSATSVATQDGRVTGREQSSESLSASVNSVEDLGLQLARKCSRYIVDIVKTEAQGDGVIDVDGGDAGVIGGGMIDGVEMGGGDGALAAAHDDLYNDEDVWGVIGPLDSALDTSPGVDVEGGTAAAGVAGKDGVGGSHMDIGIGVVEEVSSSGESPAARRRREEEEERRLVEERVRHTVAAVASAGAAGVGVAGGFGGVVGGGGGPRMDLGPGAGRWRRAVTVAAEASALGTTEGVVLVTPKGNRRGRLSLTDKYLSFLPETTKSDVGSNSGSGSISGGEKAYTWVVDQIERVRRRRYRLRESALEVFLRRGKSRSLFVDFGSDPRDHGRRNDFIRALEAKRPSATSEAMDAGRLLKAWQRRRISNFEYLMGLNTLAGRSFNDLCQYPVFPWVLSDYTSDELDLTDKNVFRDLKKPMGALTSQRLAEFIDRYRSFDDPDIPAFMYGSHYSTAVGVVLHYLVRLQPFADLHREMQNGTFDVADRLFNSVARSWDMCTSALSEVKELTPEWYSLPDFLTNVNGFALGNAQDGTIVNDVQLPPWANGPADFILKHRAALESDYVSANLHHWIDLIFGYKQRGPAAKEANNVFYYLTYYGAVDLAKIQDEGLRRAMELQIAHFGQCPAQLFNRPHPARGQRRQGVPRPLMASLTGLERWKENGRSMSVRSCQRVLPLSRSPVGVRACRALPDGRLLSVNGLGVLEQFDFSWREWPAPSPSSSAAVAAPAGAVGVGGVTEEKGHALLEEKEEAVEDRGEGEGNRSGASATHNSNRGVVASGIWVERKLTSFDHIPRIPLGTHSSSRSSPYSSRSSGFASSVVGDAFDGDVPLPSLPQLPPSPVCFSPSGMYLFSGGHPSGALLMWQFDASTGQVCGEMALHGHSAPVTCLASCGLEASDRDLVLSGAADGTALLWSLRRLIPSYISTTLRRPAARRCPSLVIRGHRGPVTACAVSDGLGLALTCSDGRALLTAVEGNVLLRYLRTTAAENEDDFGADVSGADAAAKASNIPSRQATAMRFTACALADGGYAAVAGSRLVPAHRQLWEISHEVEVFTVNGMRTGRVTGMGGAVRWLSTTGRVGDLLVIGGEGLMLEVRVTADLSPVWSLDPESWATIDCFSGPVAGAGGIGARGGERGVQGRPAVECVELGPNPKAPVLVCVGTSDGSLLVQALPDAEEWLRNNLIVAVGSMLIKAPGKVLKGTVNTAHTIVTKSYRGVGGLVHTTGDFAKEVVGEVGTFVKDVQRGGFIRSVMGYIKREDEAVEDEAVEDGAGDDTEGRR